MATATDLMNMIRDGGRRSYTEDGFVAPVAFLFNAEGVGIALQPTPSEDRPPYLMARLISLFLPLVYDARYVGASAEGWAKTMKVSKPEEGYAAMDGIHHGDLQKAHDAGDESIKTSVISMLLDMEQPELSRSGHSVDPRTDAEIEAEVPFEWEADLDDLEGWPDGDMADILRSAFLHTKTALEHIPDGIRDSYDNIRNNPRTIEVAVDWVGTIAKLGILQMAFWFGEDGEQAGIKVVQV